MKKLILICVLSACNGLLVAQTHKDTVTSIKYDTIRVDTLRKESVKTIDDHLIITDSILVEIVLQKTKEINKYVEQKDYGKMVSSILILLFAVIVILKRKKNG